MEPLSRAKLKLFTSLKVKKYRYRHEMFWVEGKKMFQEAYQSGWEIVAVVVREDHVSLAEDLPEGLSISSLDVSSFNEWNTLQQPEGILTVLKFPTTDHFFMEPGKELPLGPGLILDRIQDPGNLGTLIRTVDWFGLKTVILSQGCADVLNPKTLRSTMGAIFRINIQYVENITSLLNSSVDKIWLADMEGQPLSDANLSPSDFVVIGNEANGISEELRNIPDIRFLSIPGQKGSESLNAAIAGGIFAWELSRKMKGDFS